MSLSTYSGGNDFSGNCLGIMALRAWLRSAKLSPEPFDTASSSTAGATPARSPTTIISAIATVFSNTSALLINLTTCPQPTPPQCVTSDQQRARVREHGGDCGDDGGG